MKLLDVAVEVVEDVVGRLGVALHEGVGRQKGVVVLIQLRAAT